MFHNIRFDLLELPAVTVFSKLSVKIFYSVFSCSFHSVLLQHDPWGPTNTLDPMITSQACVSLKPQKRLCCCISDFTANHLPEPAVPQMCFSRLPCQALGCCWFHDIVKNNVWKLEAALGWLNALMTSFVTVALMCVGAAVWLQPQKRFVENNGSQWLLYFGGLFLVSHDASLVKPEELLCYLCRTPTEIY